MRVVRAKTGEQTGDDAAQCEEREICEDACAADDQVGSGELSCVVSQRPQNAGQWEKASVKKAVCGAHHKKTKQAAHGTVKRVIICPEKRADRRIRANNTANASVAR